MKIKAKVLLAGPWGTAQPGEWLDVPEQVGKVLVEGGFAEAVNGFGERIERIEGEIETTDMPPGERAVSKAGKRKGIRK